jgi:YidC/Oxa1 family membrane protein insertase
MEKRVVLAIVLCVGILIGWNWFERWMWPPRPQTAGRPAAAARQGTGAPAPAPAPAPGPGGDVAGPAPAPSVEIPFRTERLQGTLSSLGGGTLRSIDVWGCAHHPAGDSSVPGDPGRVTSWPEGHEAALAVDVVGAGASGFASAPWALEERDGAWVSSIERGGVSVTKTLRPSRDPKHPFHFDLEIGVRNLSAKPGASCVLELMGFWVPPAAHPIPEDGVIVAPVGDGPEQFVAHSLAEKLREEPNHERRSESGWRYVGIRSDFHLGAILPSEPLPKDAAIGFHAAKVRNPTGRGEPWVDTAAASFRIPFALPDEGGSATWKFLVFAGPNSRDVLKEEGSVYEPLSDAFPNRKFLGLSFGPIARVLSWLLSLLANSAGMGWGLAVCGLTVLVRGALFPLSKKSQISMRQHAQRMAKLKPKLDAVKEKYAKNPKKQQEETMKLFREEKVSILPGGCLLAFLQMPVWISLYATLQTTFEMRHAGFLWFSDLTAPDHMFEIPWMRGVWGLGGLTDGWFNLLPILMMVTWWGSAAMTPLPEDPEQRSQAKMMRWIPLLFGVFLYQTAAGLTLYMTLSALWSIGETWFIRKVWLEPMGLLNAPGGMPPTP